jgi:hypothetical protein
MIQAKLVSVLRKENDQDIVINAHDSARKIEKRESMSTTILKKYC